MSKPSISHLPLRAPPALETLRPLPPALPSTILRPLPTIAFASTPRLPISLSTSPCSLQDQQSQGITSGAMSIDNPEGLHSQLPLSLAHTTSIEWGPSAKLCRSTHLHKPIMRYARQRAILEHGVPALQATGHSRTFNRTPESSGQSFYVFNFISNADAMRLWFALYPRFFLEPSSSPIQPDAVGSQPYLQLLPTAADHGNDIKHCQGTKVDLSDDATGLDVPTNSRGWKWLRAARGFVKWDISPYRRTPQTPSRLEVNNEMECDDARKHQITHSVTPLLPWQTLSVDFYPDSPTGNELPLNVEVAWGPAMFRRAIFAAAFESWRRGMERGDAQYSGRLLPRPTVAALKSSLVPSQIRAPLDTHHILQENPSPLQEESRTKTRPAPSSLSLSTMSTLSSGTKPYISSESQVAGSPGRCTSSPSRIGLEDIQDHRPTTDVPIEPGKQTHKRAVFQTLQNSDSTLSDSSLSSPAPSPPYLASPAASPPPRRRGRPRKKPLSTRSAHEGRILISPVIRRRRTGVAAKTTSSTNIATSTAKTLPLVNPSQQVERGIGSGHVNYTPRGSDILASIFDGDLSDLEEDRVPLSGAAPDSTCSRLPEAVGSIRLNTMWRTVAPIKVPQRHRERLAVALKGLKRGACGTVNATNSNAARNAVLARARKVEQGGISGLLGNSTGNVRSHEGQNIADAEIRRILQLLTLIRSPPEKGTIVKP